MTTDRRKEIKKRLREIKHDPTSAEPGEAQRLAAEYRRLSRPAPAEPTLSRPVVPVRGLSEADQSAVETWPPELRARLRDHALTRQILPWSD